LELFHHFLVSLLNRSKNGILKEKKLICIILVKVMELCGFESGGADQSLDPDMTVLLNNELAGR
jgi:hypothetical protein